MQKSRERNHPNPCSGFLEELYGTLYTSDWCCKASRKAFKIWLSQYDSISNQKLRCFLGDAGTICNLLDESKKCFEPSSQSVFEQPVNLRLVNIPNWWIQPLRRRSRSVIWRLAIITSSLPSALQAYRRNDYASSSQPNPTFTVYAIISDICYTHA